jgi:hypothetical protein
MAGGTHRPAPLLETLASDVRASPAANRAVAAGTAAASERSRWRLFDDTMRNATTEFSEIEWE